MIFISTSKDPAYAVIFDLDGTLVDSLDDLRDSLNRVLGELGRRPVAMAEARAMVGDGAAKLVKRALAATGPVETGWERHLTRFLEIYEAALAARTAPYPGVMEGLSELKAMGYTLAVCTNKPERPTRDFLEALGISGFFDAVAGGDSGPARKPDPAALRYLLDRLEVPPAHAVMVGDHDNDVACARAAGVRCVAVAYGYSTAPAHSLGADAVADTFAEVPGTVRALLGEGG